MSRPDSRDRRGDDTTRAERRDRYEAVLRTVHNNTTETQGPGTPEYEVVLILAAHGSFGADGVRSALQAAVENDDLLRWTGPEGYSRYTRVRSEDLERVFHYAVDRLEPPTDTLREFVATIIRETDPDTATVARLNKRLDHYAEGE